MLWVLNEIHHVDILKLTALFQENHQKYQEKTHFFAFSFKIFQHLTFGKLTF